MPCPRAGEGSVGTLLLLRRMRRRRPAVARGHARRSAWVPLCRLLARGAEPWRAVHRIAGRRACRADAAALPERREAALAGFYLFSLAIGVIIISYYGSNADLTHVLFGTVLAMDLSALVLIATISSVTMLSLAQSTVPWRSIPSIPLFCGRSVLAAGYFAGFS